jgi:hypothetical protein
VQVSGFGWGRCRVSFEPLIKFIDESGSEIEAGGFSCEQHDAVDE